MILRCNTIARMTAAISLLLVMAVSSPVQAGAYDNVNAMACMPYGTQAITQITYGSWGICNNSHTAAATISCPGFIVDNDPFSNPEEFIDDFLDVYINLHDLHPSLNFSYSVCTRNPESAATYECLSQSTTGTGSGSLSFFSLQGEINSYFHYSIHGTLPQKETSGALCSKMYSYETDVFDGI